MDSYFTDNKHEYPEPPPLTEFGPFHIPSGAVWDRTNNNPTNDDGCVALARHPSGAVFLADTKLNLDDQTPLYFTGVEWTAFVAGLREGRI